MAGLSSLGYRSKQVLDQYYGEQRTRRRGPDNPDLLERVGAALRNTDENVESVFIALADEIESGGGGDSLNALPDEAMLTHIELSKKLGLDAEALRSRLRRWQQNNDDGWQEV